jgi:hypothetical protein
MVRVALVLALAAPLVPAAAAQARSVDVPAAFAAKLAKYHARSGTPIYLPDAIDLDIGAATKVYSEGTAGRRGYDLSLAGARHCGNATACFFASFTGERGASLGFRTNATLARGIRAHYQPLSCGASCSPPWIAWRLGGVRYEIQANVAHPSRTYFVALADAALAAGGR